MKIDALFCIHCGTKHHGDISPKGNPLPCENCQKEPIDLATLMLALSIMELTLKLCTNCKRSAPVPNHYCYHCGTKI